MIETEKRLDGFYFLTVYLMLLSSVLESDLAWQTRILFVCFFFQTLLVLQEMLFLFCG